MFKFRFLLCIVVCLSLFAACTQAASNEDPTLPAATSVPAEATAEQPTETLVPAAPDGETLADFVERLQTAVINQDYATMQVLMDDPMAVGAWRSEWRMLAPSQTVAELQNGGLPAPLTVQFTGLTDEELTSLLGQTPASMFGPTSAVVTALHSIGWGSEGGDEAILFITEKEGQFAWSAFLYTFGSFTPSTDSSDMLPVVETDVNFVRAQQDVVMYSGPGETYDEIGGIFDGQTALVTGQSEDGSWWRVICPDDSIGDCWVTADPAFTLPTDGVN